MNKERYSTMSKSVVKLFRCFFPKRGMEFLYLGATIYNPKKEKLLGDFLKIVDKFTRPWWCPRFFLRLIKMSGRHSAVERSGIIGNIRIIKMSWENDIFKIYGVFTPDLRKIANFVSMKMSMNTQGTMLNDIINDNEKK